MKNIFLVLFFLVSLGCKHPKVLESSKEEIAIETISDTIIKIEEKHDTFYVYLQEVIEKEEIKIKKNSSSLLIKKKTGSNLMIVCNEDELKLKLDSVIRLKSTKIVEKKIVSVEKCNSRFHIFCTYFTIIAIVILLLISMVKKML